MTIPDAVTMNARSCAGDPTLGETYVELARRGALDARTATMCMLMIERRRGEASAWREYVDALPRRYDAPLSFSEEELERELKGTPAFAAAKAQRASATKMFEENIRPAVRALTQADNAAGGSLHVLPEVSEREFLWAYQTFWSRAVSIPVGRGDAVESGVGTSVRDVEEGRFNPGMTQVLFGQQSPGTKLPAITGPLDSPSASRGGTSPKRVVL